MSDVEADKPVGLSWRSVALYVLLIGSAIAGFYALRSLGRGLVAPAPSRAELFGTGDTKLKFDALLDVLLALAVVIVTARFLGTLFAKLKQPAVIGEVLAGILLGPSLLGRVAPQVSGYLLPTNRVISPTLFAMLVIMAIVTTMATTPLLDLLTTGVERRPRAARAALQSRVL